IPEGRFGRRAPRPAAWSRPHAGTHAPRSAWDRQGRGDRRSPRSHPSRESQDALADDVALDLARPTHDRVGSAVQEGALPVARREQRFRSEKVAGRVVEALAGLRPEQLHQARLGTQLLAACQTGERAGVVEPEDLRLDPRRRQPLANERIVEQTGTGTRPPEQADGLLLTHLLAPDEATSALVGEDGVGHPPALVLRSDDVLDRHLDVVEKSLVELTVTGHLPEGPHVNAFGCHGDGEHGDALALGSVGIGTHQSDAPVGELGAGRPDLLPRDHIYVAVSFGARRQAGKIAPRARLAEQLAPD